MSLTTLTPFSAVFPSCIFFFVLEMGNARCNEIFNQHINFSTLIFIAIKNKKSFTPMCLVNASYVVHIAHYNHQKSTTCTWPLSNFKIFLVIEFNSHFTMYLQRGQYSDLIKIILLFYCIILTFFSEKKKKTGLFSIDQVVENIF